MIQSRLDSYFLRSSSRSSSTASTVIDVDSDAPTDDEDEQPPAKRLRSSRTATSPQQSIEQYLVAPAAARSSSLPIGQPAVARPAQPVAQRALSDISNAALSVTVRQPNSEHAKKRQAYLVLRARFAHPDNSAMCAYCGTREHSAIHHEGEFRRSGAVSSTCCMHQLCRCPF
jgi:hypothetical protein